jgi:t-SNARE complex subunit (syntaxin)
MSEKLLAIQALKKEQDEHLDGLSKSLTDLNQHAKGINAEINSQIVIIKDIENDVDVTSTNMGSTNRIIYKFLEKNEKCCWIGIIAFLLAVFIILVIVASL